MTALVLMAENDIEILDRWQAEADRRWPDAMDMVEPASGTGRWATVAWCGPLTVHLHRTLEAAERAMALMASGCGHDCWNDHELVDLAEPDAPDPIAEYHRGPRRAAHAEACRVCQYVFSGAAPRAAMLRAQARRRARRPRRAWLAECRRRPHSGRCPRCPAAPVRG